MTVFNLYNELKRQLQNAKIEDYNTESKIIIEKFTEIPFEKVILNPEQEILHEKLSDCFYCAKKRIEGQPLQYLIGYWEFYSRKFFVGKGVLIPRSDTEILIDHTLNYIKSFKSQKIDILDLCSGSGCIGITVAKEVENSEVFAVEISKDAITYLEKNKNYNKADNLKIVCGDVLNKKTVGFFNNKQFDIILSNPPYIKKKLVNTLQKEVLFEPVLALDGGDDGLVFYREILKKWSSVLKKDGFLGFEIGYDQSQSLTELFSEYGYYDVKVIKDYSGNDRVISGRKS